MAGWLRAPAQAQAQDPQGCSERECASKWGREWVRVHVRRRHHQDREVGPSHHLRYVPHQRYHPRISSRLCRSWVLPWLDLWWKGASARFHWFLLVRRPLNSAWLQSQRLTSSFAAFSLEAAPSFPPLLRSRSQRQKRRDSNKQCRNQPLLLASVFLNQH